MKTAALFEVACRLGGYFNLADAPATDALARYGRELGVAYQIYDDCLDIFGLESEAGKSLGTDVATGKPTLPVLLALEAGTGADRRELKRLLSAGAHPDPVRLRALLARHRSLERAVVILQGHLNAAATALDPFDDGPARRLLLALPRFIASRTARLAGPTETTPGA